MYIGHHIIMMKLPLVVHLALLSLLATVHSFPDPDASLKKVFAYIDSNENDFVDKLREAVAIRTVSASVRNPSINPEFNKMEKYIEGQMKDLGIDVQITPARKITLTNGQEAEDGSVILGELGKDKDKPTLLIYGHLDVQPAERLDGWNTDPFNLTEIDGNLYGRGSTDDKGPVLGWLNAIEAFIRSQVKLPVNLKIVLEMGEEEESVIYPVLKDKKAFLKDVDAVAISDSYWNTKDTPAITYGLRAISYCEIEIIGGTKDLHSGTFGGAVHEPMWDMVHLLNQLVDSQGNILIPGIRDDIDPVSPEEQAHYEEMDFDLHEFQKDAGVHGLLFRNSKDAKELTLMHKMRFPSLTIHGIEGAFCGYGQKTVIPHHLIGKFSMRLVNNMIATKTIGQIESHIERAFLERNSRNRMKISCSNEGEPWKADIRDWNYKSATSAIEMVYRKKPQFTRAGASVPGTVVLQDLTKKSVILIPMGQSDDGQHAQNEKLSRRNYIQGTKVFAAYMASLAKNFK